MADSQKTFNLIIKATAQGVAQVTKGIKTDFEKSGKAMTAFNKVAGNGKKAVGLLTNEIKALALGLVGLKGFTELTATMKEADKAAFSLEQSVSAASREFKKTGDLDTWKGAVNRLSGELKIYSETSIKEAISRTIDMTKRLGLSAAEMEIVIARTGDLSAGKVDLTAGVERVTAALRGEAEASEYLGLTLNENYVKAWYKAHDAHGKAWKDLNDLEKAQVRYKVFLEQTAATQGKAAASTLTFSGALDEMKAKITDAITKNKEIAQAFQEVGKVIGENSTAIGTFIADIVSMVGHLISWSLENKNLIATFIGGAGLFMAIGKIITVIQGLSAAVGAFKAAGLAKTVAEAGTAAATSTTSFTLFSSALGKAGLAGVVALLSFELGRTLIEHIKWSAEMDRGNQVLAEHIPLIEKHGAKLKAIANDLGIAITDQQEYNNLMKVGAITRDEATGKLELHHELYIKYHAGLLKVAEAEKGVAETIGKTGEQQVAALQAQSDYAASLDALRIGMPGVTDAVKSFELTLADLKLALAQNRITQEQYNQQMLAAEKAHWAEMVKTRQEAVNKASEALKAGTGSYEAYEQAVLALRDAQLEQVKAEASTNKEHKTSVERLKAIIQGYKDLREAYKGTGDAADKAGRKSKDFGDKLVEAGKKGKEGADTGQRGWQSFADQVGITLEDLKAAIAEVMNSISEAKAELSDPMDAWRKQTERNEFSASASSIVDSVKNADPFTIQRVIDQQNDILNSQSKWLGTDDKAEARWIIEQLEKAKLGIDWREEKSSTESESKPAGSYDIVSVKNISGLPGNLSPYELDNLRAAYNNDTIITADQNTKATQQSTTALSDNTEAVSLLEADLKNVQSQYDNSYNGADLDKLSTLLMAAYKSGNLARIGATKAYVAGARALLDMIQAIEDRIVSVRGFASGGSVPGSGSGDTVPAMLTPGEFVIKKSIVSLLGADFFAALNDGIRVPKLNLPVQKFATGGQVQPSGETINLNFGVGGQVYPVFSGKDVGTALVKAVKSNGLATV